jgi:hypothetical protein
LEAAVVRLSALRVPKVPPESCLHLRKVLPVVVRPLLGVLDRTLEYLCRPPSPTQPFSCRSNHAESS